MERDEAIALLRDTHSFPGLYEFRVVIRPPHKQDILAAMAAAIKRDTVIERVGERFSKKGEYLALHVEIEVQDAEQVLDVYAALKQVDGVVFTL